MDFFCNLGRQNFARHFHDPLPGFVPQLVAGNELNAKLYLIRDSFNPSPNYPFYYDDLSGAAGVTAKATLLAPSGDGSYYAVLSGPTELSATVNAFSGVITTITDAINIWLQSLVKDAFLSIDLIDAEAHAVNVFLGALTIRRNAEAIVAAPADPVAGTLRLLGLAGFTGGGSTKVDGAATTGKPMHTLYMGVVNGTLYTWELLDRTASEDPPYVIFPDDNAEAQLTLVSG